MGLNLFDRRALLFLPASNPRAIAKARASDADLVVLDLEDAVKPEDKASARDAAVAAVGEAWPMPVAIRINGTGSEWHDADLAAVAGSRADFVVVPLVGAASEVEAVAAAAGRPVAAMIETAAGVLAAPAIATVAAALIAGTNDLSADLRLPPGAGRAPLQAALQHILIAARASRIAAFDGVFNKLDDAPGLASECAESRMLGFDGKSLIHPDQIAACHAAFAPGRDEIERAERLIAAATGGAERFEGAMIEAMHVEAARRLLNRVR
ncbi:MAG: CoA ester lyase [Pseudomonadota bacterium]|nr:CoA ester lyase [Pseudomonadota bacterium]